ncbi:MAG: sigma-70 family RNA polymerase sigma factor [bacterium]
MGKRKIKKVTLKKPATKSSNSGKKTIISRTVSPKNKIKPIEKEKLETLPAEEKEEIIYGVGEDSGTKDALLLYFNEIRAEKVLSAEEEKKLIKRLQRGDSKAREIFIKANLKLVVKIAKKYSYSGIPLIDLIEEGNMGLMKGIEKFEVARGFRFSTYGTWWIKQAITRAIANQRNTIRIPVHIIDIYYKYLKLVEKGLRETGRKPDEQTCAEKLKISSEKLNEILNIVKTPSSLDVEYEGEEADSTRSLKDTIEDKTSTKPDEQFFEEESRKEIMTLISKLSENEQKIIINRFGLGGKKVLTLETIGAKLKLTRERIRQIETIAIGKMKLLMKNQEIK